MDPTLNERIKGILRSSKVVLFMKGSKRVPQCGFSAQVVSVLTRRSVDFLDVDVLSDPELRQGMKEFSKWPTFPQLFVDGKLVGGADIVTTLDQSGGLASLLAGDSGHAGAQAT
jgi:monothiol glutaredoxin